MRRASRYTRFVAVSHHGLELTSTGHGQLVDLTPDLERWLAGIEASQGVLVDCDLEARRRRVVLGFVGEWKGCG